MDKRYGRGTVKQFYVLFFAQQERYANKQAEGEMIRSLQGLVKGLQDQLNERGNRLR